MLRNTKGLHKAIVLDFYKNKTISNKVIKIAIS